MLSAAHTNARAKLQSRKAQPWMPFAIA
jgi:hypothetical protein